MSDSPLVLFIPGLKPKPHPAEHEPALRRCLQAGLEKADPEVAAAFSAEDDAFDLVSWTYDFYGEHRDFRLDRADIERLLSRPEADARDRAEAESWRRRSLRAAYMLADRLPFLIPKLADENLALHLRDLRRYVKNVNDIAQNTRRHLKLPLKAAAAAGRPVLLLAHSMGSVIAWDSLWQLSRDKDYSSGDGLSLLMTLGSPLGQHYLQKRLLGAGESGSARYPSVIRDWINVAAVGELTALDRQLKGDFGDMVETGLVADIRDIEVYNWYREGRRLNVHAEYGYLANRDVAAPVARWWREQRGGAA